MQDRPTAAELVEAVREFLQADVLPELASRKAFHTRVAINVLGIVGRELAAEDANLRAEWERYALLVGESGPPPAAAGGLRAAVRRLNEELARRIRSGEMDDRWDETVAAVKATVADKLAVANPGWA